MSAKKSGPAKKRVPAKKVASAKKGEEKAKRTSLFERASGAFGLDNLAPAAVPDKLEDEKAKKFAPRREPEKPSVPETPKRRASDWIGQPAAPGSAIAAPAPVATPEPEDPAVILSGEKRQIVRSLLREQGLIDPDGGASTLLEEFRIVKRQVLSAAKADGTPLSRRVLVCSPHTNEGKTFCALNLAMALAGERDMEVLLVDADFGKPSIMGKLGLEAGKGFMDVLADPATHVEDFVVGTNIPGLWILPAGKRTGRDSEYLASERTWTVLNRLTRGAPNRILVFDSPPTLAATPAAELAKHVGQALLVARADMSGRAALEDAIDLLSACPDIKLLLNDATFSPSGRKFGSYYGYEE
ncbi:capsular biosynthesis protein [Qipengyuania sp. 6D47A]|uniref:Capsular biosynthesis protein n=1 Tax=Qipengyuania qiaonensis TaxID=2867240 RepID=A0ABS7J1E0_9SPHN|nr:capsular biosynthesis protein [Qipengyuania qiaonensis]